MTILRVQGNARGTTTGNSITVTLASNPINVNMLIAVIATDAGTIRTVSSITQTGVTWSLIIAKSAPFYARVELWLGVVGAGALTGITIALSGAAIYGAVANVCEYSGLATTNYLDQTASANHDHTPCSTGTTAITTVASELWIGGIGAEGNQSLPTNGFTLLDGITSGSISSGFLEKIVSAKATANTGTTIGAGTHYWGGVIATFKSGGTIHTLTITEQIGGLDSYSRANKTCHRIITEGLGLKETRSRSKTISRVITELIGVKDAVTKVAWHWSLPPVPPVITAAVGKIKHVLLDKFLGWLEQPAEDNPRVQCDVKVSWTQTNRIASSIKDLFTETVTIKAKVAHVFTETMPITAALLHEFTESVQIRSGIIQKFEETRNITADLMKAVIEDGFKVFGEVTPLLEKLRELKRRIEEN